MYRLFVYGTLQPGQVNYRRYFPAPTRPQAPGDPEQPRAIAAWVRGDLFDLPRLGYPAAVVGKGQIWGYILEFCGDRTLVALDALEGYRTSRHPSQNTYNRGSTTAYDARGEDLGPVWIYWMQPVRVVALGGVALPEGRWPPPPTAS